MKYILILPFLISGCSHLNQLYKEPLDGERARVRFATNATTVLRTYSDTGCSNDEAEWLRLSTTPMLGAKPKSLGMQLNNHYQNAAKEVFVKANQQINGLFVATDQNIAFLYTCGVPFSFTFLENKDYEVMFNWQSDSRSYCNVTISEIVQTENKSILSLIATFSNKLTDKNKECLSQATKLRLY